MVSRMVPRVTAPVSTSIGFGQKAAAKAPPIKTSAARVATARDRLRALAITATPLFSTL